MKQLLMILLLTSTRMFPALAPGNRMQFPDSNIILYTLESSYDPYKIKNLGCYLALGPVYKKQFPEYAEKLANKTLTVVETKLIIAQSIFPNVNVYRGSIFDFNIHPTHDYVLAVLSKYRIS